MLPTVRDVRAHFINELLHENYTKDRNGGKTIEMIGACFVADEESIFGEPNQTYINSEIDWYLSQSTNIYDIYEEEGKQPPLAWLGTANQHGEINSNYGYLIFDDKFYNQYDRVLDELTQNPDSRRGQMIYNRPSIWTEFNDNGKNDFICTNAVGYYIRNGQLHANVQMRSNDVVFGYKNDYAWQKYVQDQLAKDLGVDPGQIVWQVANLHVYDRHFHLVN
jgi:thymidylate synthase